MAKESGIGDRLYVAGRDLSGDIGVVNEHRRPCEHCSMFGA